MAWKCPQCRQTNENALNKCTCGYAYYDVLGLKEDAPAQSVEQTYNYLIKVWKTPVSSHDTHSRGKLNERVKKINDAYAVFRQISKEADSGAGDGNTKKIAAGVGIALLVIAAGIFFFSNQKSIQPIVAPVSQPAQMAAPEKNASAPSSQPVPGQPSMQQPSPERRSDAPDMSADKTPDWAIDSVKKSRTLDRSATVDALLSKWTKENSDKLKVIGWIARKVDEKSYLVTYTATDGVTPTGFYFEVNVETGEIRNIAGNADLQQKYGIKGN
ncbi:MAG: hypothetical protein Q8K68_13100 [Nitrospirota bacterium]|nr:hypothetical protein [Nitrospirota bacterium]